MMRFDFQNREQAEKAMRANMTPRYCRLEAFESWVDGTQYQGLPNWWDDDCGRPLWERAPCVEYPVVDIAIRSNVDLVLGDGRFPVFSSKPGEDESDESNGLNEDQAADLDRFVSEYHRISRFASHAREAFASAQGCGTAVALHGARDGIPFSESIPAKWATPRLGIHGEVLELEIRYPYLEEYRQPDGKWALRAKLYRRVIDAKRDITYKPADAREDGAEPSWQEDPELTITHGFGFCPAVWYPFMRGSVPVNQIDGSPIHAGCTDEIRAHDIARSQWHRGALLSEPQIVETGVPPGYNPTETGRTAIVPATEKGGAYTPGDPAHSPTGSNPARGGYLDAPRGKPARKKGPGYIWQFSDPDTKVSVLTYPGDALKAQEDNARDLRIKLQEALCVVFLDPESIKFAATTSGKALEAIKQKQIDRCAMFRDDLRDGFFLPSLDVQMRVAQKLGKGLRVPGIEKALPLLTKFSGEPSDVAGA